MKRTPINRRSFLRTTSVAVAGISLPYLIPSRVLGAPDRPGTNERVNVAIIGAGRPCPRHRRHVPRRPANLRRRRVRLPPPPLPGFRQSHEQGSELEDLRGLSPDDRPGEARRRDDRDHHPRSRMGDDPGDASGHGCVHREADVLDDCGRPGDGRCGTEVPSRHAGRHATTVDAHQQLGQRLGQERRWARFSP